MVWEVIGLNYWENKDCPRRYLENALIELVEFVEGEEVDFNHFNKYSDSRLRKEIGFYEGVADK